MSQRIRTYTELARLQTFEDRYEYLRLKGAVGRSTFGFDRYLNQQFYRSREWKLVRNEVIARDLGCDLGVEGFDIHEAPLIHHMNPMTVDQVIEGGEDILNPEFLITVTHRTHNGLHYGQDNLIPRVVKDRTPGDTKLW